MLLTFLVYNYILYLPNILPDRDFLNINIFLLIDNEHTILLHPILQNQFSFYNIQSLPLFYYNLLMFGLNKNDILHYLVHLLFHFLINVYLSHIYLLLLLHLLYPVYIFHLINIIVFTFFVLIS
jgi:hypothetical protein